MHFGRFLAPLLITLPLAGQYSGPAILSRGEAPAAMSVEELRFRPFAEITEVYDSGLSGVSVKNAQGDLANAASLGSQLSWGISGSKGWRRTKIGLDYRGSLTHYLHTSYYDSTNQTFLLGVSHQFSRHASFRFNQTAGTFSRTFGQASLTQTVPFDPASTHIPSTDFFDNRTLYLTSQAAFTLQKTARLSFNLSGDGFVVRRRSQALDGVVGTGVSADVQYRLSRRSTIGAAYNFEHYQFTRVDGGTDAHGAVGTYAIRLGRWLEFSGYAGFFHVESKFVQQSAVDPVIAAILGISSTSQIVHTIRYTPNFSGRLSRTFRTGVAYVAGGQTITPGNGLFLTSTAASVLAGYGYTGKRRWSFNLQGRYTESQSQGPINGEYSDISGTISISRSLARSLHVIGSYAAHQYSSGDFVRYNRLINTARVGLAFTPGDVPLRIW